MFNSLHILFLLKTACSDNNVTILPDLNLPPKNLRSFKTSLQKFAAATDKFKSIEFFSVEPLGDSFAYHEEDEFILRCVIEYNTPQK